MSKATITIPLRINGKTTSITLKKNIISLWLLLKGIKSTNSIKNDIVDFVYDCSYKWKGESAKGFSDFITEQIILTFLEKDDIVDFYKIKKLLDYV